MTRRALVIAAVMLAACLLAPPAQASHHLIKIREVYVGSNTSPDVEYVELQMYSSGQRFFQNSEASVRLYNGAGTEVVSVSLNANMPNGANQTRVMVSTGNTDNVFGPNAETNFPIPAGDNVSGAGGAACFVTLLGLADCVSWGNFAPPAGGLPSPTGGNTSPAGIPDGSNMLIDPKAIRRSIGRGCNTLLEGGDDKNIPTDWTEVSPNPLNNGVSPPEETCPNTRITKRPDDRTTDRRPTFKFKSAPRGADFRCKLQSRYEPCESPFTSERLSLGKHEFRVRAVEGQSIDPSPAKDKFKVVRD